MPGEHVQDLIDFNDQEARSQYGALTAANDLAFALVEARRRWRLSQADLAKLIGTSQSYVAKLESGEANPTIRKVGSILAAMWLRLKMKPSALRPYRADDVSALNWLQLSEGTSFTLLDTGDLVPMEVGEKAWGFWNQELKPITCEIDAGEGRYIVCR